MKVRQHPIPMLACSHLACLLKRGKSCCALALVLALLISPGCTDQPSTSNPTSRASELTAAAHGAHSLHSDSLWQARVVDVPDTLKYGVYSTGWERMPDAHLNDDGTIKVIFESRYDDKEGEAALAARGVWKSTWKQVGDVFVITGDENQFFPEGEGLRNAGWVVT